MTVPYVSNQADRFNTGPNLTHISLDASIVAYFIQVIGSHTGLHRSSRYVEYFSSQSAHFAHALLALHIQEVPF
jgi:hypothetical protein